MWIRTGSVFDPPERIGLAQITGIALRTGGTALKTGQQFDDLLESLGATVETAVGESQATISFFALKDHAESFVALLKEMVTQPGFRPEQIDQARLQLHAAIEHRNDNAEAIARREFRDLIFGKDSPFGWETQFGTIDRVRRSDVRNFYQRYAFPANMMLGVRGDFESASMKSALEKLFADWTVRQPPVPEFPKVRNAPSPGVFLVEKKDITQPFFTIGHLGGQFNDKDYPALEILANLLTGPNGRLAARARSRAGTPMDVKVNWNAAANHPGLFEISGSTRSISTLATIKAVQEELERLRTSEVTDDELRLAREAALRSAALASDSKAKLFFLLLNYEYYGYPKDFLQTYLKGLQSVTRTDVVRAAKEFINPANLSIVVTGNPVLFGDPLDRLGPVTKLEITIPLSKSELAESTDSSLAQGKQILAKAQAAAGGADLLGAVRDSSMLATYAIDASVANIGGMMITQTDRWVSPTHFRQDSSLPAGRVSAYTDGKIGWIATPQGWGALAGPQSKQVLGDLFRLYFRLLLSDRLEGRTVNAVDDNTVQISDTAGQVASVEFDPQTGLPHRVSYDTAQAAGPPIYTEDVYDDFRDIGGVKLPFKITINQGGRRFADVLVKQYRINTGIKPIDLAVRPQ
jgi:zinc protease